MVKWLQNQIYPHIHGKHSLLDLCGGIGSIMMKHHVPFTVVVEVYLPYLLKYKSRRPDINFVCADVTNIGGLFNRKFDLITCLDGVEHLNEKDTPAFLDWIDDHFNKTVIILTPDRYVRNNAPEYIEECWGVKGGGIYQEHRCCVPPSEFAKRGYKIVFKSKRSRYGVKYNQNIYVKSRKS